MREDELRELLTSDALQLLESLDDSVNTDDVVRSVQRLRSAGHSAERVAAVLTQFRLRRKGAAKFGHFATNLLFTEEGLEQATRLEVASVHAARFVGAQVPGVIDLGCGIGADSLAFAGAGLSVQAVEQDEVTAGVATFNLSPFHVNVRHGDAFDMPIPAGWGVWADPARRSASGGVTTKWIAVSDYSPALEPLVALAAKHPIGIKLSPALKREEIAAITGTDWEAQWVSHNGEVVEMTVWGGGLQRPGIRRSALVLRAGANASLAASDDEPDTQQGPLGRYLYEPDGAVIRARLVHSLATQLRATALTSGMAYLSSNELLRTPLADAFEIDEVYPLDVRTLTQALAERHIGALEIKKRGVDVDPAEFRKRLKLNGTESATLILTRVDGTRKAILARRISESES